MDYRWEQAQSILMQRHLTRFGHQVQLPVTAGLTAITITARNVEQTDTLYGVQVTPNWNTVCWVTARTRSSYVVNFSVAAPANALVDTLTYRSE